MKKLPTSIVVVAFLLFSNAFSQGTIKLTFMATHNNEYIILDSIFVENLTRNGTMTLYYPDTILYLTPNNGISDYYTSKNSFCLSQNFPNPFDKETTIQLFLSENQNTTFRIYNFQGQELANHEYMLCTGIHSFAFYPGKEKNYLLSVSTDQCNKAIKLINIGNNNGSCDLVYNENMPMKTESKSIKTPFPFINGDQLKYTGYATPCNNLAGSGFLNHTPTVDDYLLFNISSPAHTTPTLTTIPADSVSATTAISGGNISSDGCYTVTARGVCWGHTINPVISGSHIQSGSGLGTFFITITGLNPNNIYYVRAYATNSAGTAYGNNVSITTLNATLPTLTTTAISSITGNSAVSGGNITNDGGAPITSRGVCYSTSQNPTINDLHTNDGTGAGIFISSITGLAQGFTYYVRAYATNILGTSYGTQLSFTTINTPSLITDTISNIGITGATGGGNITSDGGSIVTERGICWSTAQNPTVNDVHTSNGAGTGIYTSNISGLTLGTIYFVRAYATNGIGTAYGNEISFTTLIPNCGIVNDIDGNVYNTVTIGYQCWLRENLKTSKYRNYANIIYTTTWIGETNGAYGYYNNNSSYNNVYGKLYNWYAVNNINGLCPTGWHVPTDAEWTILIDYLGGENVAGAKLKETDTIHWNSPNSGATNETRFYALPGGVRRSSFVNFGMFGYWWTATEHHSSPEAFYWTMGYDSWSIDGGVVNDNYYGMSVRCLKD